MRINIAVFFIFLNGVCAFVPPLDVWSATNAFCAGYWVSVFLQELKSL